MILYLISSSSSSSSITASISPSHSHRGKHPPKHKTLLLLPPPFLSSSTKTIIRGPTAARRRSLRSSPRCSFLEAPVLWAGRVCVFYALLKAGLAGSPSNPIVSSEFGGDGDDLGFSKWFESFQAATAGEKEANERRKFVRKWHVTTKGTLKRSYRVPSKAEGRRLLKAVASLLSDDDHFVDASSHKGCQIRRENAHGESVCCNNVRALFDELPTPHLVIEITAFPAGPLTDNDYVKADKLERVLRSGSSI